jgi:hypothetical protein
MNNMADYSNNYLINKKNNGSKRDFANNIIANMLKGKNCL